MYLIKELSEISGVTVRTLHHYDKIGLLVPNKADNGYRYYSDEDLSRLQTILFYKYLGFPLKKIKDLLNADEGDLLVHLKKQLSLMEIEKNRILTLIETINKTIESKERGIKMTSKEMFKGFSYEDNKKYKEQAIKKYGEGVVTEAYRRQEGSEQEVTDGFNEIFFAFAKNNSDGLEAKADENLELAKRLHEHLNNYAFDCSLEVFSGIAKGYVANDEFKNNIDQFGLGTAETVNSFVYEPSDQEG